MAKHTPTPWVVSPRDKALVFHPFDGENADGAGVIVHQAEKKGNLLVSREEAEANAAFIVKAVNAHEDLVAALRLVDQFAVRLPDDVQGANGIEYAIPLNVLKRVINAVAKAEG